MRQVTAAVALLCAASPLSAQTYVDPSTGVEFPTSLAVSGGATQQLTGTGVRTRTMLKVKVYAFGLYVDPAGAKSALAAWAGKTAAQLQADDAFYGKVLERSFPMTLRLVMTRNVGGATMAEAFDGALRPRVVAAAGKGMTGGEAALDQFRGFFGEEVTKGTELVFSCTPEGRFTTSMAGQQKPELHSPALCWALFDVYLGAQPISPDGKKSVVANFPALLR
ncbi:MAG: chalcone isomerase family protein [Gemmatimonadales bacterium]